MADAYCLYLLYCIQRIVGKRCGVHLIRLAASVLWHAHWDLSGDVLAAPASALCGCGKRERELHLCSHTGPMQVLPGHPPADPRVDTNKSCAK